MSISTGPPAERRTMLDRLTLYTHAQTANHRSRYARALKERQRLLNDLPSLDGPQPELDAYERILAEHGSQMTLARREATVDLEVAFRDAFEKIAAPGLSLEACYEPGGSEDEAEILQTLRDNRAKDARRKRASFGPHQDDLSLRIDGHPARVVASQGQHRALTLALKAAEMRCITAARDVCPLLLLDDVSSELDADRTRALFDYLALTDSQIFLTTTRRDLIVSDELAAGERRDFHVVGGVIQGV
jgi:DNA replication and repair protein RecF